MKNLTQATPQNLTEAVLRAVTMTPLNEVREKSPQIIKDFLAQRFAAAILKAKNAEEENLLEELFKNITEGV